MSAEFACAACHGTIKVSLLKPGEEPCCKRCETRTEVSSPVVGATGATSVNTKSPISNSGSIAWPIPQYRSPKVEDSPNVEDTENLPPVEPTLSKDLDKIREEFAQLNNVSSSSGDKIGAFLVSILLFGAASILSGSSFLSLTAVAAVLLVHELGHILTMMAFGFKGIRMLFIPLVGAVVSAGKGHRREAVNAIVYLMGPVTGIIVGFLVHLGMTHHGAFATQFVTLSYVINIFNLLPLYPLDGGRYIEAVALGRFPRARVIFQAITGAVLLVAALWSEELMLGGMLGLVLCALPTEWHVSKAVLSMRQTFGCSKEDDADAPTDAQLGHMVKFAHGGPSKDVMNFTTMAKESKRIWNTYGLVAPDWAGTFGLLWLYVMVVIVVVALGSWIFIP